MFTHCGVQSGFRYKEPRIEDLASARPRCLKPYPTYTDNQFRISGNEFQAKLSKAISLLYMPSRARKFLDRLRKWDSAAPREVAKGWSQKFREACQVTLERMSANSEETGGGNSVPVGVVWIEDIHVPYVEIESKTGQLNAGIYGMEASMKYRCLDF